MVKKEDPPPSSKPAGAPARPTISLPPRPYGEAFFNGGLGFSPGPMTLVSSFFSDSDDYKSFSQLLAGAMASPVAQLQQQQPRTGLPPPGPEPKGHATGGVADSEARFKQNRPTNLSLSPSPGMFTVPPGLSPASLLESPSFLGLFSPQAPYGMTHQQALAQVTAQAAQANAHMQVLSEYSSAAPATSVSSFSNNSTGYHQIQPSVAETSDVSVSEQRSQPSLPNADKPGDDGYNWRKYGQKQVKGSEFPRSYYKCTHPGCPVKKKVERSLDGQVTEIIYKGQHNHQPPQSNKRSKDGGSSNGHAANPSGSDLASQLQGGSFNASKKDHDLSQATAEHVSGTSDSEEVANAEGDADERDEDEPDPKRRSTEDRVSEPVSSHKTVTEPRIIVQTTSEVDLLDDGYRWRKYGQKVVKGNPYPRSYYKCTTPGCNVRKHVERAASDPKAVITTYEGKHNHDVPAARSSSHSTASQFRPDNSHASTNTTQQPIARLRLKEELT